jgi:quercetin dioxygenase-like cupin family protein
MEDTKVAPITTSEQDGQTLSVVGDNYRILAGGDQTGGAFATIDMLIPPNGGPGPHSHANFQETFYVVDGEIEVKSEAGTYTARKGAYVIIPEGGIIHSFKNKTENLAHILCTVIPSGLEEMFIAMGKPVTAGTFLAPPAMDKEGLEKMQALAAEYGQKLYPPDLLDKQ